MHNVRLFIKTTKLSDILRHGFRNPPGPEECYSLVSKSPLSSVFQHVWHKVSRGSRGNKGGLSGWFVFFLSGILSPFYGDLSLVFFTSTMV